MGPDLLPEADRRDAVQPPVGEVLGVVAAMVEVRHERGSEVQILRREQQLEVVRVEPGGASVVEVEMVVGGPIPEGPRVHERLEDEFRLGHLAG